MTKLKSKLSMVMLILITISNMNIYAQNQIGDKKMFVRVFDFEGKKIGKGYVAKVADSTLELSRSNEYLSISLKEISYIKTKRSTGSNALIGSIAGATTLGVLGAATADPDAWIFGYTAAEGASAFGLVGAIGGGAIGGLTSVFKNSKTFVIEGDKDKWELFRKIIE